MRNRRPSGVRLYVLDAGLIECADYSMFSPSAAPGVFRELSVRSYLVVHPRGTLLWDSGIDDAIAGSVAGRPVTDGIVFRVPRTLRSQLAEIGAAPGAVDYLGLSHLHVDHVGNVGLFPEARVLVQRAEYDAGYGPNPERFTLIPETYAALDHDRIRAIEGDHDLFGDGTVVLTALPGHTPGHQGAARLVARLRARSARGRRRLLRPRLQEAVRRANVDVEQSQRSIQAAKRIERDLGATVWLHHDLDAQRAVRTAPRYYE